jgi:hypothetical protein
VIFPGGLDIQAIEASGMSIGAVIVGGVEVWPGGGNLSGWNWIDDFTSDDLHERWNVMFGDYDPPGLSNMTVIGPEVDDRFLVEFVAGSGGGVVSLVTGGFSQPVSLIHAANETVQLVNGSNSFTSWGYAHGTPIRLKREDGFFRAYIDGEIAIAMDGGQMMFEDTVDEPVSLGVAAYGTIESVKYRKIKSRYSGSGVVVREGTWGPFEVEGPGWVFRSFNALNEYEEYGYYDITVEAWGGPDVTAALDVNESWGQYEGMTRISADTTTTGDTDKSVLHVEGLILGYGDTIWMGAESPVATPLQGRYLVVRTGDVEE